MKIRNLKDIELKVANGKCKSFKVNGKNMLNEFMPEISINFDYNGWAIYALKRIIYLQDKNTKE